MKNIDRRHMLNLLYGSGITALSIKIVGCGSTQESSTLLAEDTVTLQDIRMEGWSTLGSGFLGENGVLKADVIKENETIVLSYVQDPHGHKFTLTKNEFAKLRRGQIVEVLTTYALDHRHKVVINPQRVVSGSTPVTMPVDPDNVVDPGDTITNRTDFNAMLTEGQEPDLYIALPEELEGAQVTFCANTEAVCADETNWDHALAYKKRDGLSFFVNGQKIDLANTPAESQLRIRAKKDGKIFQRIAKFLKSQS